MSQLSHSHLCLLIMPNQSHQRCPTDVPSPKKSVPTTTKKITKDATAHIREKTKLKYTMFPCQLYFILRHSQLHLWEQRKSACSSLNGDQTISYAQPLSYNFFISFATIQELSIAKSIVARKTKRQVLRATCFVTLHVINWVVLRHYEALRFKQRLIFKLLVKRWHKTYEA